MLQITPFTVTLLCVLSRASWYVDGSTDVTLRIGSDEGDSDSHSMKFTETEFQKFYICLCNHSSSSCTVNIHSEENFFDMLRNDTKEPNLQSQSYICHKKEIGFYSQLSCHREFRNKSCNSSDELYLNFRLTEAQACDFSCVGLTGTSEQKIEIVNHGKNVTETCTIDYCDNTGPADDEGTYKTIIIVAVTASFAFIVLLMVASLFWCGRKRGEKKSSKLPQENSQNSKKVTSHHCLRAGGYEYVDGSDLSPDEIQPVPGQYLYSNGDNINKERQPNEDQNNCWVSGSRPNEMDADNGWAKGSRPNETDPDYSSPNIVTCTSQSACACSTMESVIYITPVDATQSTPNTYSKLREKINAKGDNYDVLLNQEENPDPVTSSTKLTNETGVYSVAAPTF